MKFLRNVFNFSEVEIYKRKISRKKARKHDLDQEENKKETTNLTKKKGKKTRSWPSKQERTHDLDKEKKFENLLISFINSHLRFLDE